MMHSPIEKNDSCRSKTVVLQDSDGQYFQACMVFPDADNAVSVRTVKAAHSGLAVRFCTVQNAEKFAALLNTHEGVGYWSRVVL